MFSDLPEHDVEAFAELVQLRRYPRNAVIVNQHDTGGCMYLLVSGRVKVTLASPDGKELALNYLEAPSHFGEMSLVDAGPRSADVIATTDVEVLALEGKDLSAAVQIQPKLAVSLIATLSNRLRQTIGRLEDMAFHDATHRVMRVVLNVATASYESQRRARSSRDSPTTTSPRSPARRARRPAGSSRRSRGTASSRRRVDASSSTCSLLQERLELD